MVVVFLFILDYDVLGRGEQDADHEAALDFLSKHCRWAVVTLGPNGCIAKSGKEVCDFKILFYLLTIDSCLIIIFFFGIWMC